MFYFFQLHDNVLFAESQPNLNAVIVLVSYRAVLAQKARPSAQSALKLFICMLKGELELQQILQCYREITFYIDRRKHKHRKLSVPQDFRVMADHIMTVPRLYMELFAVVCIETSHYVAFVKAGSGPDAPWCFFDSMADRKGRKPKYSPIISLMICKFLLCRRTKWIQYTRDDNSA